MTETERPNPHHFVERRLFMGSHILIETHDLVTLVERNSRSGVARSGKPWTRWSSVSATHFSIRTHRDGTRLLTVYRRRKVAGKRGGMIMNVTAQEGHLPSPIEYDPRAREAIIRLHARAGLAIDDRVKNLDSGQSMVQALSYPFLLATADWDAGTLTKRPYFGLAKALRADNARDFAVGAFGVRRLRKDLIRASMSAPMRSVAYAAAVKHLVPVDWLVEYLRGASEPDVVTPHIYARQDNLRLLPQLLELVPAGRRRAFLLSPELAPKTYRDGVSVRDAHLALGIIRAEHGADSTAWITDAVRDARTWAQLDTALARVALRIQKPNKPIEQDAIYAALDGQVVPRTDLRLVTPKETETLEDWGDAMDNCIGSYGAVAVDHRSYLLGVYRGSELLANAELLPNGTLRQLFGRFNQPLEASMDEAVSAAILANAAPALTSAHQALELAA
ncbi:hypothetical protein [Frigoribacterium sp. SL97]|uniref:hypothetical protein n=1 Tax=Frigoribacterium sp. SL97 TaxID=2994664 RepID=UPI002271AAE4|nr:hypothetical protein [Frigoribacterium sp. SL97]WAC50447.1 hypothetical protein OVA02_11250 [Frigoribacterium sp. SL97]